MRTLVIADTVPNARIITDNMAGSNAIPLSPRSIRLGAGRGIVNVTDILVDDSAWPLSDDVLEQLAPHGAPIHHRRNP